MIERDANVNIINRFGEEEGAKRIQGAQNVVKGSVYKGYDVDSRMYKPERVTDGAGGK